MDDVARILQRERWLPFVQKFFTARGRTTAGGQVEAFIDKVFPFVSQASLQSQTLALQTMTNYYEDGPLITKLLTEPGGELWRAVAWTIYQHLTRLGLSEDRANAVLGQVVGQLSVTIKDYQYQVSFASVVESIIRCELKDEIAANSSVRI